MWLVNPLLPVRSLKFAAIFSERFETPVWRRKNNFVNPIHTKRDTLFNAGRGLVIFLLRLYGWTLSPLKNAVLGPSGCCRFSPTCSHYALDAVRQDGVLRGGALALKRICRCHPWGGFGADPVPPSEPGRVGFTGEKLPDPNSFQTGFSR